MSVETFLGRWWIVGASSKTTPPEVALIQDVEFSLLRSGDVVWENCAAAAKDNTLQQDKYDDFPLFATTTYQVLRLADCLSVSLLLRFSAWQGNVIEFRVEQDKADVPRCMYLTLEGWCTLQCIHIRSVEETKEDFPFSFAKVLELNDELSRENTGGQDLFVSHEIRDKLQECDSGVRDVILHYLHTHSLPSSINHATVKKVSLFITEHNILKDLEELCSSYRKALGLQNEFALMVKEIHCAVDEVLLLVGGKVVDDNGFVRTPRNKAKGRAVRHNPPELASIQKTTFKNIVFVLLKTVQFCVRYEEVKRQLSREDQTKILMFAKSRLVIFFRQILELFKALKYATVDLTTQDRLELASYLVGEVEEVGYLTTSIGVAVKELIQLITQKMAFFRKGDLSSSSAKSLKWLVLGNEVLAMFSVSDKLGVLLTFLIQEWEAFVNQSTHEKIRDLGRQVEQVVNEIPLLVLHTEKFVQQLQEEQGKEDHTFLFNLTAFSSQIAALLARVKDIKEILEPSLQLLTGYLSNQSIATCLEVLGLTKPKQDVAAAPSSISSSSSSSAQATVKLSAASAPEATTEDEVTECLVAGLDLTSVFSTSPLSKESRLAELAYRLFRCRSNSDLVFELRQDSPPPLSFSRDVVPPAAAAHTLPTSAVTIPAHRAIVCARCPWFLRALTSGMREERERRIVLHDCDPDIFNIFLQFIYSGLFDLNLPELPTQTVADVLLLADRYEMCELVDCCEDALCRKLEDDTVFPLLVLADQFNTPRLRHACFDYIACKPSITTPENINQLTDDLRREIICLNAWIRPEFNFDDYFDVSKFEMKNSTAMDHLDPFLDYNLLEQEDPLLGRDASHLDDLEVFIDNIDEQQHPFRESFNPSSAGLPMQAGNKDVVPQEQVRSSTASLRETKTEPDATGGAARKSSVAKDGAESAVFQAHGVRDNLNTDDLDKLDEHLSALALNQSRASQKESRNEEDQK